jgi:hypothetical protein
MITRPILANKQFSAHRSNLGNPACQNTIPACRPTTYDRAIPTIPTIPTTPLLSKTFDIRRIRKKPPAASVRRRVNAKHEHAAFYGAGSPGSADGRWY